MAFNELDAVALESDIPGHGLNRGDIGAVVQVCSPESVEVEFVRASGATHALLTLATSQLRPLRPGERLAMRQMASAGARS